MRKAYNLIDYANEVEIALRDILFMVENSESDMRAYVITGQTLYFNSFARNKWRARKKIQDLYQFVKDSSQASKCSELSGYLEERFLLIEKMGPFAEKPDSSTIQQIIKEGEALSNEIENYINVMIAHEKRFLSEYEQELYALMDLRRKISIFGGLLAMILGFVLFNFIRKESALIQKRQDLLQELNDNKDKFFSIISHDLKNPFTAIKGLIELLNYEEYKKDKKKHEMIYKLLHASSDRFDQLLNDLLTWARLQMNTLVVKSERINVTELLQRVKDQYQDLIQSKGLKLEIGAGRAIYALADKAMTETILRNLISNAVKFTESGTITLSTYSDPSGIVMEVKDTGTGIDEAIIKDLFQLGRIQSKRGTRNEVGTGMGLILCKDMAERQGGSLRVSSLPGKGTTVKLILNQR